MSKGARRRIPWSIRLALFLAAAFPGVVCALFSYRYLEKELNTDAEQLLLQTADALKNLARQRFDMVENHRYMSESSLRKQIENTADLMFSLCIRTELSAARRHLSRSTAEDLVIQLLASLNESKSTGEVYGYILSGNGKVVFHPRLPAGFDLSHQAFVQDMKRKSNGTIRYYWKNPGEPEASERLAAFRTFPPWDWLICVAGPSGNLNDPFEEQSIAGLKEYIVSMHLPWAGEAMILSKDGRIVAHPILSADTVNNIPGGHAILEKGNGLCRYIDEAGHHRIAAVTTFQPWDWILAVSVQEDVLYAPVRKLKWLLIGGTAILAIINDLFLITLYRKLALMIYARRRPIHPDSTTLR